VERGTAAETGIGAGRSGRARYTGRHLIVLGHGLFGDDDASLAALRDLVGVEDIRNTRGGGPGGGGAATLFASLGVAVAAVPPDRVRSVADDERVLAVEPERVLHALAGQLSEEYLRGFRDAATYLHSVAAEQSGPERSAPIEDSDEYTWGLQVTGVGAAAETGAGTTVAVLDTGLDLEHPDFAGRDIESRSFVEGGGTAQDGHGHGTHCTGTACGPLTPETGRRYGIAHEARILVGKVLSDEGQGTDAEILAGISWAIESGATVVSMSLGADVDEVSTAYETIGRRALAAGTLIVAAAGNNAARADGEYGFVGVPANSESIMAVGAVDGALAIADFSARSSSAPGGQVDLVAPGVDVYSAWPLPERTNTISGTSMATPHVAGIAALWSQRTGATGEALWSELVRAARRLPLASEDAGAGLAQAPPPA
jgi:subtilisin